MLVSVSLKLRQRIAVAVLLFAASNAHACLFATSTSPEGWYEWARALFAGDVTQLAKDAAKPVDIITVRVVETFKGRDANDGTLTVRVPSRHWKLCKMDMPALGTRVLVALNPSNDVMLLPLSDGYAEQLRRLRRRN
jgi:hypothetical protein